MSLARTALRLAALNALKGSSPTAGPTIACNRFYDSRISDFSPETYPDDAKPTVIVLTDEDDGDALSEQNGGPPFRRKIKLVFEFAMVQGFDVDVAHGGTEFVPGYPATDAEHEASLDLLEFQIMRRLAYDPAPGSVLFRNITRSWKHDCHRQVLDETGVKIAARVLTLETEVTDDQVKVYRTTETLPTGLDVLPEPLRTVAKSLPVGSNGRAICTAIAAALAPLTVGPFAGMDTTITDADNDTDVSDRIFGAINLLPPTTTYTPGMDFRDARNSQYLALIGAGRVVLPNAPYGVLNFSIAANSGLLAAIGEA
jgi:hypothetical protein